MNNQIHKTPRRFSVSSWSVHHALGAPSFYGIGEANSISQSHERGEVSLLDLPARLATLGIHTLEICHFHLPSRDAEYLSQLRGELEQANVELWSLLIDDGDLSHVQNGARDAEHIAQWLEVAQALGARRARVIAGKTTGEGAMERSVKQLRALATRAHSLGLRLMTENWYELLSTPQAVHHLFRALNGDIGLCLDFGNWSGNDKYEHLASIAPLAESCHTKANFFDGQQIDTDDYMRCLDITRQTNFEGPYTLIYSSPGDEWRGLQMEMDVVRPYLS